ncbi:uncharacterized protein TM35_000061160, partial [Trypanosoma theileri]
MAIVPISVVVKAERGFSFDVPAEPYDIAYNMYFQNYENAQLCTLSAVVNNNNNNSNNSTLYTYWGCPIHTEEVNAHLLLPLTIEEIVYITTTTNNNSNKDININNDNNRNNDNNNSNSVSSCDEKAAQSLLHILQNITMTNSLAASGIAIVLSTHNNNNTSLLSSPLIKRERREERKYDMSCFLEAVKNYNEMEKRIRGSLPLITAVAFSDDQQHLFFSGGRPPYSTNMNSNNHSPSKEKNEEEKEEELLLLPREVRSAYNFILLYYPMNKSRNEWISLLHSAEMNRVRWGKGYVYPQSLLEIRNGMKLAESSIIPVKETTTTT